MHSKDFIGWLARHVLPHEPALRAWLKRRARLDRIGLSEDDLVQETYAKLAALQSVDHITNPRAYIFRVAYTVLLQEIRARQIVPIESIDSLESLEFASHDPAPDRLLEVQQELRIMTAAINSMPRKCREIFVLKKVEGLSQREISERLGISENTVETQLARGAKKLLDFYQCGGIQPPFSSARLKPGEFTNGKKKQNQRNR